MPRIMNTAKTIEEISKEICMNQANLIEHISIKELKIRIRAMVGGRYVKGL